MGSTCSRSTATAEATLRQNAAPQSTATTAPVSALDGIIAAAKRNAAAKASVSKLGPSSDAEWKIERWLASLELEKVVASVFTASLQTSAEQLELTKLLGSHPCARVHELLQQGLIDKLADVVH